ncbi:ran-binding protein 9-like [Limulus polyphemus]|uniref:Ran-binding protein 9-like n=1 Tax=Limulus polyphemus TaxID=6850 RepID=A0ABM1BN46_LIMPO|nr:ran-binding protein 9-like [Limulus polyphemus]
MKVYGTMAAMSRGIVEMETPSLLSSNQEDRIKLLYPMVNEDETPLPRHWSSKDKYAFIGLSQNNLRVHYKGIGKNHKDAASVRASHPIPAACGLYYFEVKIVSKGRDGYMGIGLSAQGVNMNRLPGWDKHSYGYHGDDGHSFCSSGTGQPYGPTFTTGDVIGCGVNLIDNTCFYTKNGVNLGIAFTDLPPQLYPTVGLQTPGEIIDANFGQYPFVYDIQDMMKELQVRTQTMIRGFPTNDTQGEWQTTLHRILQTYLVHHGYCSTAEAFAKSTGQAFLEEVKSIKNRQKILKLVLAGRIGEAIDTTRSLYPGLLERNPNLLFLLKCRQFIEMVNGTDSEVRPTRSPTSQDNSPARSANNLIPTTRSAHTSILKYSSSSPMSTSPISQVICDKSPTQSHADCSSQKNNRRSPVEEKNITNSALSNGNVLNGNKDTETPENICDDVEMDKGENLALETVQNGRTISMITNGNIEHSDQNYQNGNSQESSSDEDEMDVDPPRRLMCGGSQLALERMLQFGRELHSFSVQLKREFGTNDANKKMLQDAFSLLAYSDPWNCPVGYQLDPVQREPVCAALNGAVLESHNLPRQPPLELALAHAQEIVRLMSSNGLGSSAFANFEAFLH